MMEFTDEQMRYINSDISKCVFLEACPGSGKTEVVAEKVAGEIKLWDKFPGGIAVLSFANSATDELKSRVEKRLPIGRGIFPHFMGTYDSFIYKNIVNPLSKELTGYSGERGDCSIRIIDGAPSFFGFKTKYSIAKQGYIYAHNFSIRVKDGSLEFKTGNSARDRVLNSYSFEGWQRDDLLKTKNKMISSGYATYGDIETLAVEALSDDKYDGFVSTLAKRWPLIIIDECQDLSYEQLLILQRLMEAGVKVHFVGDLSQSIYGFRNVDPSAVKEFSEVNNFLFLKLTRNFRSCQRIIDLCNKLAGAGEVVGQLTQLEPTCYLAQYDDCPTELINVFKELCQTYDETVIVSRGHSLLSRFNTSRKEIKPVHKLALSVSIFNSDDMECLKKSLTLFSEFLRHYLKEGVRPNSLNCPQSVDSTLEWRRFLLLSLDHLKRKGFDDINIGWSAWISAVKQEVQSLSDNIFLSDDVEKAVFPLKSINLRAPHGEAKNTVANSLGCSFTIQEVKRKSTIHGVKGETHDVTILLSSPSPSGKPGSHWKSWLKSPTAEAARFAYVASSRPKYRLIWAVKRVSKEEEQAFIDLGFRLIN